MTAADLLCFSHLRWNFVFQRPNHLMSRFARERRVFFIEDPISEPSETWLEQAPVSPNLWRVVPHVSNAVSAAQQTAMVSEMLQEYCEERQVRLADHWYYTPMMLAVAGSLPRRLVVYDCMDELSNFLDAPRELRQRERQLLAQADVVFTGGMALYEAKRTKHHNVHGVPSSVDVAFFKRARRIRTCPEDQASIAGPRIGYCGVIDERIDLPLLESLARQRPNWQIVMIGPVVKIDESSLPRLPNIHYLGPKHYEELPNYLAGWDVAIMPFALNDATHFISPTKTPEYLAAGKPVVSTAIRDVVVPYEELGLVRIGRSPADFIAQIEAQLRGEQQATAAERDSFLAASSWDLTFRRMQAVMDRALAERVFTPASQPATRRGLHV